MMSMQNKRGIIFIPTCNLVLGWRRPVSRKGYRKIDTTFTKSKNIE